MIEQAEMLKDTIVNCDFAFKCPKQWEKMEATEAEGVRFCGECEKNVFFAETTDQLFDLAGEGNCVAVWREVEKSESDSDGFANDTSDQTETRYEMLAGMVVLPERLNDSSSEILQASEEFKEKPDPFKQFLKFLIVASLAIILLGAVIVALLVALR